MPIELNRKFSAVTILSWANTGDKVKINIQEKMVLFINLTIVYYILEVGYLPAGEILFLGSIIRCIIFRLSITGFSDVDANSRGKDKNHNQTFYFLNLKFVTKPIQIHMVLSPISIRSFRYVKKIPTPVPGWRGYYYIHQKNINIAYKSYQILPV